MDLKRYAAVFHKQYNKNFFTTGMEGWGVMKIMEELKASGIKVTRLTHDRDASTFKNVFEGVAENYCTCK